MMGPSGMAGGPVVVGWTVHGSLDIELLGAAVRELSRRMPVLAARVVEGPDGPVLRRDRVDASVELEFVPDGWAPGDAAFLRPGERVLRVLLRREGPDRHGLALLAWHAVSDGACLMALHRRLWEIYRGPAEGGAGTVASVPDGELPRPVEELLRARYGASDVAAYAASWSARLDAAQPAVLVPRAARDGGPGPGQGAHRHRLALSAEQTRSLVRQAHRWGATVNSVVCALAMRAVRELLPREDGPVQLTCLVPVDVRSRLRPPLPSDEFAFAASTTSATALVGPDTELDVTAPEISRQVRASLDAGHAELEYLATSRMLTRLATAAITLAVSNVSHHCAAPTLPDGLTAERPYVITIPPGPLPTLFVTRHREAICLDLIQPRAWYTHEQAGELADALRRALSVVTGAPGEEDLDRPVSPSR
ncbi:phthiocerol/phthiodiolone dimycocerosyl transferase family protein [Streptomyces sp. LaBMicrA B280]|uniref:phthiocerol/phthiodiolone dimycocerosyl transferase family protein n=1 Tax=Streptomyces sp. LaBMicrA B280 TaxID=3391001 RepID=UPI003BA528D9